MVFATMVKLSRIPFGSTIVSLLNFLDVEEILAYRGIDITYESIRQWRYHFGQDYFKKIRAKQGQAGDIWHLDEVFINIMGKLHYL